MLVIYSRRKACSLYCTVVTWVAALEAFVVLPWVTVELQGPAISFANASGVVTLARNAYGGFDLEKDGDSDLDALLKGSKDLASAVGNAFVSFGDHDPSGRWLIFRQVCSLALIFSSIALLAPFFCASTRFPLLVTATSAAMAPALYVFTQEYQSAAQNCMSWALVNASALVQPGECVEIDGNTFQYEWAEVHLHDKGFVVCVITSCLAILSIVTATEKDLLTSMNVSSEEEEEHSRVYQNL